MSLCKLCYYNKRNCYVFQNSKFILTFGDATTFFPLIERYIRGFSFQSKETVKTIYTSTYTPPPPSNQKKHSGCMMWKNLISPPPPPPPEVSFCFTARLTSKSIEYIEWQRPLSGVHSITMEKLAQACDCGGCTPPPHPLNISTITYIVVVYTPAERADTLPLFLVSTCSTTGKPTRSFATERVSLDSV